jgi:hypothetical protein
METSTWKRQEIAYRIPNPKKGYAMGEWKRCTPKTEAAFDRKILSLQEKEAEINTRDAD